MYLVFWGPKWTDSSQPDYSTYLDIINQERLLFSSLAGSGYNGILTQYSDSSGHVLNTPSDDILEEIDEDGTTPPPNIDMAAEAAEISNVAQQIPNWATVPDKMVILLPQEASSYADPALDGHCAYHYVSTDGNNNLYAVVPYLSDPTFSSGCLYAYGDSSASDLVASAMTVMASGDGFS